MDSIRNLSGFDVVLLVIVMLAACGLWIQGTARRREQEIIKAARAARAAEKIERLQAVKVGAPVPVPVKAVLHDGPPTPFLDSIKSEQALAVERWIASNECKPERMGFTGNFAMRGERDLSRRHSVVSERLRQIETGEWPGAQVDGGNSGQ